jgi:hypothetical protein
MTFLDKQRIKKVYPYTHVRSNNSAVVQEVVFQNDWKDAVNIDMTALPAQTFGIPGHGTTLGAVSGSYSPDWSSYNIGGVNFSGLGWRNLDQAPTIVPGQGLKVGFADPLGRDLDGYWAINQFPTNLDPPQDAQPRFVLLSTLDSLVPQANQATIYRLWTRIKKPTFDLAIGAGVGAFMRYAGPIKLNGPTSIGATLHVQWATYGSFGPVNHGIWGWSKSYGSLFGTTDIDISHDLFMFEATSLNNFGLYHFYSGVWTGSYPTDIRTQMTYHGVVTQDTFQNANYFTPSDLHTYFGPQNYQFGIFGYFAKDAFWGHNAANQIYITHYRVQYSSSLSKDYLNF